MSSFKQWWKANQVVAVTGALVLLVVAFPVGSYLQANMMCWDPNTQTDVAGIMCPDSSGNQMEMCPDFMNGGGCPQMTGILPPTGGTDFGSMTDAGSCGGAGGTWCEGQGSPYSCFPAGTQCTPAAPVSVCGDSICDSGESTSCPSDCGLMANGCSTSTPILCSNGSCKTTQAECDAAGTTPPATGTCTGSTPITCSNGTCATTAANCPQTGTATCGNFSCDAGETAASCPGDCSYMPNGCLQSVPFKCNDTALGCKTTSAECGSQGVNTSTGTTPATCTGSTPVTCPDGTCALTAASCTQGSDTACDFDGVCEYGESFGSCPNDCKSTTTANDKCNGVCGDGEDSTQCPGDCQATTTDNWDCGQGQMKCPDPNGMMDWQGKPMQMCVPVKSASECPKISGGKLSCPGGAVCKPNMMWDPMNCGPKGQSSCAMEYCEYDWSGSGKTPSCPVMSTGGCNDWGDGCCMPGADSYDPDCHGAPVEGENEWNQTDCPQGQHMVKDFYGSWCEQEMEGEGEKGREMCEKEGGMWSADQWGGGRCEFAECGDETKNRDFQRWMKDEIRGLEQRTKESEDMRREIKQIVKQAEGTESSAVTAARKSVGSFEKAVERVIGCFKSASNHCDAENCQDMRMDQIDGLSQDIWDSIQNARGAADGAKMAKEQQRECVKYEKEAQRVLRDIQKANLSDGKYDDIKEEFTDNVKTCYEEIAKCSKEEDPEDRRWCHEDFWRDVMPGLWESFDMDDIHQAQSCDRVGFHLEEMDSGLSEGVDMANSLEEEGKNVSELKKLLAKGKRIMDEASDEVKSGDCEAAGQVLESGRYLEGAFMKEMNRLGVRDFAFQDQKAYGDRIRGDLEGMLEEQMIAMFEKMASRLMSEVVSTIKVEILNTLASSIEKLGLNDDFIEKDANYAERTGADVEKLLEAQAERLRVLEAQNTEYETRLASLREENKTLASRLEKLNSTMVDKEVYGDAAQEAFERAATFAATAESEADLVAAEKAMEEAGRFTLVAQEKDGVIAGYDTPREMWYTESATALVNSGDLGGVPTDDVATHPEIFGEEAAAQAREAAEAGSERMILPSRQLNKSDAVKAILDGMSDVEPRTGATYPDLAPYAAEYVVPALERGLIEASDIPRGPADSLMTRGDAMAMAARAAGLEERPELTEGKTGWSGDRAKDARINAWVEAGVVEGQGGTDIDANSPLNRAELFQFTRNGQEHRAIIDPIY